MFVAFSFGFAACSDEDDSVVLPAKRLVKVEYFFNDKLQHTTNLEYGDQGLITRSSDNVGSARGYFTYGYQHGSLIEETVYKGYDAYTILYTKDEQNRISESKFVINAVMSGEHKYYHYNNLGYLEEVTDPYGKEGTIKFERDIYGDLIQISSKGTTVNIKYSNIPDKLGLNFIANSYYSYSWDVMMGVFYPENAFYQLGLYGKKSRHLVSEMEGIQFSYELDNVGYVTTINMTDTENQSGIYKLTYEKL